MSLISEITNAKLAPLLLLLTQVAWTGGMIRLKTRDVAPAVSSSRVLPAGMPEGAKQHYMVLFGSYPGPDVLAVLQTRRVQVLAYIPENALMVSATKLNLRGLDVQWAGPMDPADKISPMVANQPWGSYLVILQPDTDIANDSELAQNLGLTVTPNSHLLAGQMLVSGAYSALPSLAALDQVAYILPAAAELQNGDAIMGCAGPTTPAGPIPQYVKANGGWKRDANGQVALSYYIESLSPRLPESQVRSEIQRAFAAWAQYANITISPASQPGQSRTIDVLFARYAHGDAYPFNGPGGVIAHTFYPAPSSPEPLAGDMHLNADESWNIGGTVDIYSVVLHEAGHALGLGHSDDPTSVMYPYYRLQTGLTADDIAGIQALYGARSSSVTTATGAGSSSNSGTSNSSNAGTASSSAGTGNTSNSGTSNTSNAGTSSGAGSGTSNSTGSGNSSSAGNPPSNVGTGSTTATADTAAPTVTIVTPGSTMISTSAAAISISGKASDNVAVVSVRWTTSNGGSGTASGTAAWSAVVPLLVGNNTVTVRAYDAAGNSSWRAFVAVRN